MLIGGDIGIVPMRVFLGLTEKEVGGWPMAQDPPTVHGITVNGSVAKFYSPLTPKFDQVLTTKAGGERVPYGPSGTTGLRWYCTTQPDFNSKWTGFTRSTTPTPWIVLEGAPPGFNDNLIWIADQNQIPSDFYYAALESAAPRDASGKLAFHDFDKNGTRSMRRCRTRSCAAARWRSAGRRYTRRRKRGRTR